MSDKKNIKIEQLKDDNEKKRLSYRPTNEEVEKRAEFEELFEKDREKRDTELKNYFNGRTLEAMLDDSQKRVNGFIEERANADDWQVRYRSLLTRNKMLAFLSKIATIRMQMDWKNKSGGGNNKKLQVLNALYHHYRDMDNGDMKQFMALWNAWQDGTVFTYISPVKETQKMRDIVAFDEETGEYESEDKVLLRWKVKESIIPLQDVWFGDFRNTDEQDQPHQWLRFEYNYQDFWKIWGKYPNAKYVSPSLSENNTDVFYREDDIGEDKVEVLIYFNKWEDRMVVYGNKVELYDGPLPFGDKEGKWYPVAVGILEPIASDCIYGKSGADKLRRDQDMIDLFFRKMADRAILVSDPPVWQVGGEELPEEVKLKPGLRMPVDNLESVREFAFADNQAQIVNALKLFQNEANLTGGAEIMQGVAGANRTATAEMIAEKSVQQLVGLSQFFVEDFLAKSATIFVKTILAGIDTPELTIGRIKKNSKVKIEKTDFGTFVERNVAIPDTNLRGDIVYTIVGSPDDLHTEEELNFKAQLDLQLHQKVVKYIEITTEYFNDILTEVKAVPGSSLTASPAMKKAMETEFLKGYMTFFPQLFMGQQTELAKDYLDAYEKEIDRIMGSAQQAPQMPIMGPDGQPMPQQGVPGSSFQGQVNPAGVPNAGVQPELQRMVNA